VGVVLIVSPFVATCQWSVGWSKLERPASRCPPSAGKNNEIFDFMAWFSFCPIIIADSLDARSLNNEPVLKYIFL